MKSRKINLNRLFFFTGLLIVWLASHSWIALLGVLVTRIQLAVGKESLGEFYTGAGTTPPRMDKLKNYQAGKGKP